MFGRFWCVFDQCGVISSYKCIGIITCSELQVFCSLKKCQLPFESAEKLGMFSNKMSIVTVFGHKNFKQNYF